MGAARPRRGASSSLQAARPGQQRRSVGGAGGGRLRHGADADLHSRASAAQRRTRDRAAGPRAAAALAVRSEEHTSELQSLMRISYAVFCLKKKNYKKKTQLD